MAGRPYGRPAKSGAYGPLRGYKAGAMARRRGIPPFTALDMELLASAKAIIEATSKASPQTASPDNSATAQGGSPPDV